MRTVFKICGVIILAALVFLSGVVLSSVLFPNEETPGWFIGSTCAITIVVLVLMLTKVFKRKGAAQKNIDFILENAPSTSVPKQNPVPHHSPELYDIEKADEFEPSIDVEYIDNDDYYESEPTEAFQKQMEREKQIESFSISDMDQFVDIPFAWSQVMQLQHSQRKAWMQLNMNNQQVALDYIMQVNQLIVDSHAFVDGISSLSISPDDIDFWFPVPMKKGSINNTYVECTPYTPTGKVSKYPATIHFASTRLVTLENGAKFQEYPITGIIKILRDGNIGLADVVFSDNNGPLARYEGKDPKFTRFRIGLFGLALVVKRIDNEKGNLFKFEDFKKKYMV